ncbi:MAG TPA: NAD(P)H-binding protein [Chthoniobacterales bacterium]
MNVFVTGGTGYIGSRLIPELSRRGHQIRALVRAGSETRLPPGAEGYIGDALNAESFADTVRSSDTFVHLIGVPHPSPAKAAQFREIDLVSIRTAVSAAANAGIRHFVYLSVAQPAPVMKVFQEIRRQGEELIRNSKINATFVRPWYVLGPGHRWPIPLVPFFWLAERIPQFRESSHRLGFVTITQMINALVWTIENPPDGIRLLGVSEIRAGGGMNLPSSP